jgi:peptide/nickel transport system ATP-binding protein
MHRGKVRYGPKSQVLAPPFDDYTDLLLASCAREMKVDGSKRRGILQD